MKAADDGDSTSLARFERVLPFAPQPRSDSRIRLKSGARTLFVRPSQIDWIEAAGNYSAVRVRDSSFLVREQLGDLVQRLPSPLMRIHRSILVNVSRVIEIRRTSRKTWAVVLVDGKVLPLAAEYREILEERLLSD